jgi:AraC family transcriptional regulator
MELQAHGARKYPASALLESSAELGWSSLSAELRSHPISETPLIVPQHTEICLAIIGSENGLLKRTGAGERQLTVPKTGTIWLSPVGIGDAVTITAPIPQTMHLYLHGATFDRLTEDFDLPVDLALSIGYVAGIHDEVIQQIGFSILTELTNETAAGRMYVETASLTLEARLLQKYCNGKTWAATGHPVHHLDQFRLRRVLDYIDANFNTDINLEDLAAIAGYSAFHFARKFAAAMGIPPHRYISRMRLRKAMVELAAGKLPLAEIALNAHFSSQASFTRAFHRATGVPPKEFRRRRQ